MDTTPLSLDGSQIVMIPLEQLQSFGEQIAEMAISRFSAKKGEVYLTRKQAAQKLSVDISTLYRWDNEGYLKSISLGNKKRYRLSDIERLMEVK